MHSNTWEVRAERVCKKGCNSMLPSARVKPVCTSLKNASPGGQFGGLAAAGGSRRRAAAAAAAAAPGHAACDSLAGMCLGFWERCSKKGGSPSKDCCTQLHWRGDKGLNLTPAMKSSL